jgi:3-deoxy-D-manno-octulosonic-acid transferase
MWLLYYSGMYMVVLVIRVTALWNPKSKTWINGRKNWESKLQDIPQKSEYRIWFHVSSLGEFEQAKPVIERIKDLRPGTEIILSFFSPSGYEQKREYKFATVLYLPADLPGNATKWLRLIDPDLAVFVKYDLWPGYLKALSKHRISALLISANWIPGSGFSSWSNPLTHALLKDFKIIFLQRGDHLDLFKRKGFHNTTVAGDTRIDRVLSLPEEAGKIIPGVLSGAGTFDLIAGSTWPADENKLIEVIHNLNLKAIIAPHDISDSNIERLLKKIPVPAIKLSKLESISPEIKVIVIDSIGLLSALYACGRIAYVGGGFGSGIHNILEPMAHGRPVIFGPHYEKFPEAVDMVAMQGAWSVHNKKDLVSIISFLKEPGRAESAGSKGKTYLEEHSGATNSVSDYILKSIPYIA